MLWFAVWVVLVLAAAAGAVVLGRRLWRSVKALLAELSRATAVADRLSEQAAELQRLQEAAAVDTATTIFADRAVVRARYDEVRARAHARAAARTERHRATWARWRTDWF